MKAALLIVLSLSALAFAGPTAFNSNNKNIKDNQIDANNKQQQYTTLNGDFKQTQATETLKQWCFSSQMSQPELTASFKKLVNIVKSAPTDESTEAAVMSERICQGAIVQKSAKSGETIANNGADVQAHELIKDVYMDALIACESRECSQQLIKIIDSKKVDPIRASYYMTRMAVAEKDTIKDESEVKQWAESLISQTQVNQESEAIERQKLLATTSIIGKFMKNKCERKDQMGELKQTAEQVAKTIVERYIRPVSQQEVQQFKQDKEQQNKELIKKIAKRNAGLKALANIPGCILSDVQEVEQILIELIQNKQELVTVRQSAIECLQHNDKVYRQIKQICFDQEEPIEVRVAALRTLMTVVWVGKQQSEQQKEQIATEIIEQIVKHCEEQRNQQQDDQFVLYAISYLDNLRTSQQPEHQAIKECISKNKQHYMQIQLLCKKFKSQLNNVRKSSRNYKLEQEFNQINSGLALEGDVVFESKQKQQGQVQILPKLIRVNMSMPVMGETVNVMEVTLRQHQLDEELLETLKLVKDVKFNTESVSKVVDSFKQSVEKQQQQPNKSSRNQENAEADLTIKVDGCTVVYVSLADCMTTGSQTGTYRQDRNTRSVRYNSIVDEIVEYLKRNPVAFNRGFNFNFNQRLAKALDVDANVIAGLRVFSHATGSVSKDMEVVAQIEPRFAFEAIVGPAKMTTKKLMQRFSTKTALGLRLRYKPDGSVDFQVDLPMNVMELFTFETQMVEKSQTTPYSYQYLPDSIYGQEDIYAPLEEDYAGVRQNKWLEDVDESSALYRQSKTLRKFKRSIFERQSSRFDIKSLSKLIQGKQRSIAYSVETPEKVARMTGLRGKLRVVASPKDLTFLVQAVCQKYEPTMQGYRVQVQKVQRNTEQKQYVLTVSTPGSRVDRTIQMRAIVQSNKQRTIIKSDIQTPKMATTMMVELIHDGRQFAIKSELVQNNKLRHLFECGVQRGSQSQSGRIATSYKPYLNIESSFLKRPIQMQGVVSYQQQPKTVITWELKCPTSSDFVQGKFIVDMKHQQQYVSKRSTVRRSMRSPIEMVFEHDLTLTTEMVAQVGQHALKMHKMLDWDSDKLALNADWTCQHKDLKKSLVDEMVGQLKLNKEQQMVTVQRKCPQQARKEYRFVLVSDCKQPQVHQFSTELRYNAKRDHSNSLNSIVAYKHKVDINELSSRKIQLAYAIEVLATELNVDEKIQGRTEATFERRVKTLSTEVACRNSNKFAKLEVEFESLEKHHIECQIKLDSVQHKTVVRADQRVFSVQSRTDNKQGQLVCKINVDVLKQQNECQMQIEIPRENVRCVVDLKLNSGKQSSWAIQTPRFASKAEFSFELMSSRRSGSTFFKQPISKMFLPINRVHFKTDLKDLIKQENYWMDSAFNAVDSSDKSYFRFDSPIYRSDVEFDPRELSTKMGIFARSKRSIRNELYSNEDSILNQVFDYNTLKNVQNKLNLNDKLWIIRSIVSPNQINELKQKIMRAFFEYADRRQHQRHQVNYSPIDQRLNFNLEHQPSDEYSTIYGGKSSWQMPVRLSGDFATNLFADEPTMQQQRPSSLTLESDLMDLDFNMKPFDGVDSYAKLSALSRNARSVFKKHESEYNYNKKHGYKANIKHLDRHERSHSCQLEADEDPKKYTKINVDSDSYGKAHYAHNWRQYLNKRSEDNEDVYSNKLTFGAESPRKGSWSHNTQLQWDEPISKLHRNRRDLSTELYANSESQRRYNTIDYLKHVSARVNSQAVKNQAQLYNLDFDYKPSQHARLNMNLPNELLHTTSFEYQPTERLYKLQSSLVDQSNKQQSPYYQFVASTKPVMGGLVSGLASQEQEPVFFNDQHPMLNRPISSQVGVLFKQPMKLDYSDKYGRLARVDYDLAPVSEQKYLGLRQKRAVVYYKDESRDIEHDSSFDFFPEQFLARGFNKSLNKSHMNPRFMSQELQSGDFATKVQTKYGPIVVRCDSTGKTVEVVVESPIINAKLTGESSSVKRGAKLIKFQVENKHQKVQLAKIIRKTILGEIEPIVELAHKLDEGRFEHQTELLVSIVDAIFKLKSQTYKDQRPVMIVEGELNKQQEKLIVKIDGERTKGQLACDLVTGSATLVLDVDDKRTIQHMTRLERKSDKFFQLESITSYKQQPLFKLSGQISAMVFEEPMHLFQRRSHNYASAEHISTFEAVIYKPKMITVQGKYDCIKKEALIDFVDVATKKHQQTFIRYDDQVKSIFTTARLSSPIYGEIYTINSKIALLGLLEPQHCMNKTSCRSEIIYSGKQDGVWACEYTPSESVTIRTPLGKQRIDLMY